MSERLTTTQQQARQDYNDRQREQREFMERFDTHDREWTYFAQWIGGKTYYHRTCDAETQAYSWGAQEWHRCRWRGRIEFLADAAFRRVEEAEVMGVIDIQANEGR